MDKEELKLLIFGISLVLLILGIAIVILFFYFQQKKTQFLLDRIKTKKKFEEELAKSRIEIRENTLENISWEIHDNVGQLLSIAKMQLNILQPSLTKSQQKELTETSELIGKSLQELRSLAKSLNPKHFKTLGLLKAIRLELSRYNRMKFIKANLVVIGKCVPLPSEKGIILFRIMQEFFNNTMKHSKSTELDVKLDYQPEKLLVEVRDHGIGFNHNNLDKGAGLGLNTMKNRAKLIGVAFNLESIKNEGTFIKLVCPLK